MWDKVKNILPIYSFENYYKGGYQSDLANGKIGIAKAKLWLHRAYPIALIIATNALWVGIYRAVTPTSISIPKIERQRVPTNVLSELETAVKSHEVEIKQKTQ